MKIAYLTDDFPPDSYGGAGFSTFELAEAVAKAGHDVSVITTCRRKEEAGESTYAGLRLYRIASDYPGRWRSWIALYNPPVLSELAALLTRLAPDVVHANNVHFYLSWASLKVAKRHAHALVWTARDTMAITYGKLATARYLESGDERVTWRDNLRQAGKRWNPLRNLIIRHYIGYADRRIAISEALRRALAANGIKDVAVLGNGIDPAAWRARDAAVAALREAHGLAGRHVLLFCGRLSAEKGGESVIRALGQIAPADPEATLLVAGSEDGYARHMAALAAELGVGERLVFTGWLSREEMKAAYALAEVVLMPSLYLDAFGRVNIEAMAAGRPVVGTCFGGTPEIVKDGVTGYIANPLRPEEIARKALDLLTHPERARAFGAAGRERVERAFSLARHVERYIALYEEARSRT
jgi:glycosyltransferase involved in cell wall biosynthesis